MRTMLACAAALAALVAPASAEVRYDRKLEEAVKARVAEKIGEIRGGFDYGDLPKFVQPDPMVTGAIAPAKPAPQAAKAMGGRSLTLAIERRPSRRVF